MNANPQKWLMVLVLAIAAGAFGWFFWQKLQTPVLGSGFTSGNGRIEATEIDVSSKLPGRIANILTDEGAFVKSGQVLAKMDTEALEAQLSQAKAQFRQAENAKRTASAMVALRESEKTTAEAVVAQRQAEFSAAEKRFKRSQSLVERNAVAEQELDDNQAAMQSAQAALSASRSQVLSAQAGIEAAKSQVVEAESAIEAAQAATDRLTADIHDCELKAPRDGRIQYRVSEVGEVLPAGGKVLNMVDYSDVYMTFFLPETQAGRVELGEEVRLVIDAVPEYVIPAEVSYVASVAQFTPKTVETASEREKLMFRVKARIAPELLKKYASQVKTGVPGMAYLKLDPKAAWPAHLQIKVPQ